MAELVRQYLGNYRLSYLLGHGGFADVYLGEHITLKTPAAIKVLRMQLVGEAQESFLHKTRIIADLDHPNIVNVLEFGVDHYTPYIVMRFAAYGTLRQRYPRGTILSAAPILPYVRQAAAALQYAHERNLIHRDIKPENLLLGIDEQVLLSDFCLAIVSQSANQPHFQETAGTTAYMAPEQLQGHACTASDQYALGIVIYEWLTGDWPFHGSDQEMAHQHAHRPPPPLAEKIPTIPPAIEQVVLKALAKNPSERFPSMQDFANAFEEACISVLDTQIISIAAHIFPAIAGAPHLEQIDTPDSVIFMPDTYLMPESSSLFVPDPINTSAYFPDKSTIITDPSLVSIPPATSADPVASLSAPVTSLSIGEDSGFSNLEGDFLNASHSYYQSNREGGNKADREGRDKAGSNAPPNTPLPEAAWMEKSPKRITRRSVLVGLTGIAAASIAGIGISTLVAAPKRQSSSRSSQQKAARASNPANSPDTTDTRKPSTPDKTSTAAPASTPAPNSTAPAAAPTDQPGSKNKQPLTIQIMNPPTQVQNNSQVNIEISTSEPGVSVVLHISYNSPTIKDVSMQQTSDSSGHANFSWQVRLPNTLSSSTTATLSISAVDQNGQKAVAAPLMVSIAG